MNAEELKKLGYKLSSNQDGYSVFFGDVFVGGAGVKLPRRKPLHWKHAAANRKDFFENAVIVANQHAAKCAERLEYLRGEILAERISMGEIAKLQSLAKFIPADDTMLLEWAGVEEKFD